MSVNSAIFGDGSYSSVLYRDFNSQLFEVDKMKEAKYTEQRSVFVLNDMYVDSYVFFTWNGFVDSKPISTKPWDGLAFSLPCKPNPSTEGCPVFATLFINRKALHFFYIVEGTYAYCHSLGGEPLKGVNGACSLSARVQYLKENRDYI